MNLYESYISGSLTVSGSINVFNNLIVTGAITAQQYIISSSVTYLTESFASGSHKFGDTIDDTHQFTGSILVTGSANVVGNTLVTGSITSVVGVNSNALFVKNSGSNNLLTFYANLNNDGVMLIGNNAGTSTISADGGASILNVGVNGGTGKVGINKTSPTVPLDVFGNATITGSLYVTTGSINSYGNGGNAFFGSSVVTAQTNVAQFQNGNAGVTSYTTITSAGTGSAVASWNTGNSQIIEFVPQSGNGIIDAYTGNLILQTGRVNAVTINSSQQTSFAGNTTVTGSFTAIGTVSITDNTATGNGDKTISLIAQKNGVGYHNMNHGAYQHTFLVGGSQTTAMTIGTTGTITPGTTGTQDLGSSTLRWGTVYTSDLSLNNGIGDWTIVEGEDDLFLYNNKKNKVYKFALTEVDPSVATPKMS